MEARSNVKRRVVRGVISMLYPRSCRVKHKHTRARRVVRYQFAIPHTAAHSPPAPVYIRT